MLFLYLSQASPIREGRQPASLFQPPAGYTKVTLQDMFGVQMPSLTPRETEPVPAPPAAREDRAEEKGGAEDLIRGVREGLKGILGR